MAEYINREAIMKFPIRKDHCDKEHANEHFINGIESVLEYVENLPAVDVAPVVHGRWLNKKEWHLGRWVAWLECSCCGEHDYNTEMYEMLPFGAGPSNYCPNCGAKMDGELNE